jgi:AcrR family transcriptional regulator
VHLEARVRFAEHGYHGATIRRIAADTGVDPALVHHYYETKEKLSVAATRFPPTERSAATGYQHRQATTRRGDRADVVRHLGLGRLPCERASTRAPAIRRRKRGRGPNAAGVMSDTILNVLAQTAEPDEAAFRASLVASQVVAAVDGEIRLGIDQRADAGRGRPPAGRGALASASVEELAQEVVPPASATSRAGSGEPHWDSWRLWGALG